MHWTWIAIICYLLVLILVCLRIIFETHSSTKTLAYQFESSRAGDRDITLAHLKDFFVVRDIVRRLLAAAPFGQRVRRNSDTPLLFDDSNSGHDSAKMTDVVVRFIGDFDLETGIGGYIV